MKAALRGWLWGEWVTLLGDGKEGRLVWEQVMVRYQEKGRYYHNLAHVKEVIQWVKELGGGEELLLAAWFHDIIYEPLRKDNERQSGVEMKRLLRPLGIEEARLERIDRLILATADHDASGDEGKKILLDADLAILGADLDRYQWYADGIRKEYRWVPDLLYKRGRQKVLIHFLERKQLFQIERMYDQFERRARENLNWELSQLR